MSIVCYSFTCDYRSCFSQHVITSVIPGPCGNTRAPLAFLVNPLVGARFVLPVSQSRLSSRSIFGPLPVRYSIFCDVISARAGNVCTRSIVNALSEFQLHREQFLLQNSLHAGVHRCGEAVSLLAGITNTIYYIVFDGNSASKHVL